MTHKRIFVVNTDSGFQANEKKGCCTPQQPSPEQIVINAGVSDLPGVNQQIITPDMRTILVDQEKLDLIDLGNNTSIITTKPDYQQLVNNINVNFGWKNGQHFLSKNPEDYTIGIQENFNYTRNGYIYRNEQISNLHYDGNIITSDFPPVIEVSEINNLIIKIPGFSQINNLQPKIIISKYKPSRNKGNQNIGNNPDAFYYRKAGFKINKQIDNNFKPSSFNLITKESILDFGQEYYFYCHSSNIIRTKGMSTRYSITSRFKSNKSFLSSYVYLQFRLSITDNEGNEYISEPKTTLKMTLETRKNFLGNTFYNSTIKFKFA